VRRRKKGEKERNLGSEEGGDGRTKERGLGEQANQRPIILLFRQVSIPIIN